jgi:hypothetical protein
MLSKYEYDTPFVFISISIHLPGSALYLNMNIFGIYLEYSLGTRCSEKEVLKRAKTSSECLTVNVTAYAQHSEAQ